LLSLLKSEYWGLARKADLAEALRDSQSLVLLGRTALRFKLDTRTATVELLLELYFFVALLSTTGLDNLVCLTMVILGTILAGRVGGLVLSSAVALLGGLSAPFS
jgi:hypothetical protein